MLQTAVSGGFAAALDSPRGNTQNMDWRKEFLQGTSVLLKMRSQVRIFVCALILYGVHESNGLRTESDILESSTQDWAWKGEILSDIKILQKFGFPGRIIVYGKHAEPILTGTNENDILVAAAEFGKGRIVAVAHDAYASDFLGNVEPAGKGMTAFHGNIWYWLTRGAYTIVYNDKTSVINSKDKVSEERLLSSKVVVFDGDFSNIPDRNVTEYVRNGGSLFYCLTLDRWRLLNRDKSLSDAPFFDLLTEAGICFTEESNHVPQEGFSVKDNKAENAHMRRVLEEPGTGVDNAVKKTNMLNRLWHLPKGVAIQLSSAVRQILESCTEEIEERYIPSETEPVTIDGGRAILELWQRCYDILQPPNVKAPGVNLFPGDFSTEPALETRTFDSQSDREEVHSTAYYLPAGKTLKVEVISGNEGLDWELMIGCHIDRLRADKFRRWPVVFKRIRLSQRSIELSTPFGGPIYLINSDEPTRSITVKLENVVESPRFRLTDGERGRETWEQSRHSSGLWADIIGEFVTITLPASSVREMKFDALTEVMQTWDLVVRVYHDLRGTEPSKFRRIWIVTDEQLGAAYLAHALQIPVPLEMADSNESDFILNNTLLRKGEFWDVFDDIGNNMQRYDLDVYAVGKNVARVFTLYATDRICQVKPWKHPRLLARLNSVERFLKGGADFNKLHYFSFFYYAQLARDFGWESYRHVFHLYNSYGYDDDDPVIYEHTHEDEWFYTFSEVVELNLSPFASFWGISLSNYTIDLLRTEFPVGFLPDDEVTRFVPDRVKSIVSKFPGKVVKGYDGTERVFWDE